MNGHNLLAYGTLMDPDIMQDVSGGSWESTQALLHGYQRHCVLGEHYPGIVRCDGAYVEGVVYFNVSADAIYRLDLFEGDMYSRDAVKVHGKDDYKVIDAVVYVVKPQYVHLLSEQTWNFQEFIKSGKEQFRQLYSGYDVLYDQK